MLGVSEDQSVLCWVCPKTKVSYVGCVPRPKCLMLGVSEDQSVLCWVCLRTKVSYVLCV